MKHYLTLAQNQISNSYRWTSFNLINVNAHAEFLSRENLLKMILTIRKSQKSSCSIFQALFFYTLFVLVTPLQSSQLKKEAHRSLQMLTPRHMTSSCWRLRILPSPLTPLVLPPPVPEPICEMHTPAIFTMAQSSPQPQSVDTASYARVNPLSSPVIFSSSSGELHLYIDSDTSSPSIAVGPTSSSQELLLQGIIQVPQPTPLFSAAHEVVATTQPPPQPTSIPFWADEVATAEQSGRSTPEKVVSNWADSGRIGGPRTRSQALACPPPVMPTPHAKRPPVSSLRHGPTIPALRPQQPFPSPRRQPSPLRRPRATAQEIYPVRFSPIQASQSPVRHTASPSRGPQPSSSRGRGNPFAPTQGITHRSQGPCFRFHEFSNPLGNKTFHGIHVPDQLYLHPASTYTETYSQFLLSWRTSMSKRDGIETYNKNVSTSPLNLFLQNDSGICPSTSSLLQIAQTTTLLPFSFATLPHTRFIRSMTLSTDKSVSYIPHRWMLTTLPIM